MSEQDAEGMREIESASHEHIYGPWTERGTEMVLFTKYYIQARTCSDKRCGWTQHARALAVSNTVGIVEKATADPAAT